MAKDLPAERIQDGSAWNEFCDRLKQAGQLVQGPDTPGDAFSKAEGYRCLTRYLRAGLESFVEFNDADFPVLNCICHETIKIIADNPDVYYQSCSLRSCHDYRIHGHRGTVDYLGFGTQCGDYGRTGTMDPTGFINSNALDINDDGSFELMISRKEHAGNWLPMTEESNKLIVRQTFLDRKKEQKADIKIERIGADTTPNHFNAQHFERSLLGAASFVEGTAKLMTEWAASTKVAPNQLPPADQAFCQATGGDPNFYYFHGYWNLAADEALIIRPAKMPDCQSWNFQLDNYWMESLDYQYRNVHLNKFKAHYDADGRLVIVIAHQNPGVANWMDTSDHREGTMCFRWVGADEHPELITQLVKSDDILATINALS